jgi:hypothetical protein
MMLQVELDRYQVSSRPLDRANPVAVSHLMMRAVQDWEKPAKQLISSLAHEMIELLQQNLEHNKVWALWPNCWLRTKMLMVIETCIYNVAESQTTECSKIFRRERNASNPIIADQSEFDERCAAELAELEAQRHKARGKRATSKPGRTLSHSKLNQDTGTKVNLDEEPFRRELAVMAQIKAYGKLAGARYIASIDQLIQRGSFAGLDDCLNQGIVAALGLDSAEKQQGKFLPPSSPVSSVATQY